MAEVRNLRTDDGRPGGEGWKAEFRRQDSEFGKQETEKRMERKAAKSFEDLIVWQKSHKFVLEVYRLTGKFPKTGRSKRTKPS